VANVIYLDSPAGVGLSYSDTRSDYKTNDTHTAADADVFLRRFFERYPEFLRNELYIAGQTTGLGCYDEAELNYPPGPVPLSGYSPARGSPASGLPTCCVMLSDDMWWSSRMRRAVIEE